MVELETETFKSSEIKGIEGINGGIRDDRHDLNDPKTKEEVLEFERKYLKYLEENPSVDKKFSHLAWFEKMGAIKLNGDNVNYTVTNRMLFRELQWKFQSWNQLRWRREKARDNSFPKSEEIDVNELDF